MEKDRSCSHCYIRKMTHKTNHKRHVVARRPRSADIQAEKAPRQDDASPRKIQWASDEDNGGQGTTSREVRDLRSEEESIISADSRPTSEIDTPSVDSTPKDGSPSFREDENKERGNWSGRFDFILSMVGFAVGLGNLWRFPYLCYQYGGGSFLVAYIFALIFIGLPLYVMELALGQFASAGPITAFARCMPLLEGIGYGMVIVAALTCIYYNMIIAWIIFYMFASFTSTLPWDSCSNDYNTQNCYNKNEDTTCDSQGGVYYRGRCVASSDDVEKSNLTLHKICARLRALLDGNYTNITLPSNCTASNANDLSLPSLGILGILAREEIRVYAVGSSEEYFYNRVLVRSPGIEYTGGIRWDLNGCLFLAWIIVCLCLIKGIKSSGKVVYVTATMPYILLTVLLIRGVTLEGAGEGIKYYLTPKTEELKRPEVWSVAAGQVFFSLGNAFGSVMTLSSYNRFKNNCIRDAIICAFMNCGTSIYGGFAIFSVIGFMAFDLKKHVSEVVARGSGLTFVVYPAAVARMPVPTLWAILFFLMLLTLGLDSQFAMMETVLTAFVDKFPVLRSRKAILAASSSFLFFLLGQQMTTEAGFYWVEIMNNFAAYWSVIILALCESVAVGYVYGARRFLADITMMLGADSRILRCSTPMLVFTWYVSVPLCLTIFLLYTLATVSSMTLERKDGSIYYYPTWSQVLGWFISLTSFTMLPIVAAYRLLTYPHKEASLYKRIIILARPTADWGPALNKYRTEPYQPIEKKTPEE